MCDACVGLGSPGRAQQTRVTLARWRQSWGVRNDSTSALLRSLPVKTTDVCHPALSLSSPRALAPSVTDFLLSFQYLVSAQEKQRRRQCWHSARKVTTVKTTDTGRQLAVNTSTGSTHTHTRRTHFVHIMCDMCVCAGPCVCVLLQYQNSIETASLDQAHTHTRARAYAL